MKNIIFLLFMFNVLSINAHFYKNENGYVFAIPWPEKNVIEKQGWQLFENAALHLHDLFEKALREKASVEIIVPDCYKQAKTTAFNAPIIEGTRVALAWASAYKRFYNVDIKIIKTDNNFSYENKNSKEFFMAKAYKPVFFTPDFNENLSSKPCVAIIGGAGFIGSHLVKKFLETNYKVIVIDNLACSTGEYIEPFKSNPSFRFYNHDASKPLDIEIHIDIVIHLASLPSPKDYYERPIETLRAGLHGTYQTLQLAEKNAARYLLGSTSEVYGDPDVNPQPETYIGNVDVMGKRSQYDQSKRGAETFCKLFFDQYGLDIRIARIFNTYGPHMRLGDGRVVTNFIQAALLNTPLTIYGTGNQTRSFAYVADTVQALYKLATNDSIAQLEDIDDRIFNVGNPQECSINVVAQKINNLSQKHLDKTVSITHIPQFDFTDPKVRKPDITKISHALDYHPNIDFDQGLEKTFLYFFRKTTKLCPA